MNNLIDIQSQIDKLQKQAADIKKRDFDKTVADILISMQLFGITVKDLTVSKKRRRTNKDSAHSARSSKGPSATLPRPTIVAAKFSGPNGETWSGRGKTPRWLAALVAQGLPKEDFAVKN